MTGSQRWLVFGLGLAMVVAIGLGYQLNQPEWVVLVNQADPKDAAAIVARLNELKVPYRPVGDGFTITVPKSEQYTAKLALAQAGLPKGDIVGMELFNEPKFGATDFERKVNYLRAQQGELERALLRIHEVEYANVKLAIPERTVFAREQAPVTAAVMVQVRQGRKLTADQVDGIVTFVAGSVQGLTAENVKVVDQSGRLLNSGLARGTGADLGTGELDQTQKELALQHDFERRVQTLLEPIFGPGNVVARVNLELTRDASRIENQSVGNATPKTTDVVREATQTTPGATLPDATPPGQGDAGAAPVYQGQTGTPTGGGDQWKTRTTTTYEVSQRKEITLVAPGSVKRISVGIAVNRPDLTPEQIKQIQETVAGATGADATSISVAAMTFAGGDSAAAPGESASQQSSLNWLPWAVGAGVLLLLAGHFVSRRREKRAARAPIAPEGVPVGTTLDVALGLEQARLEQAALAEVPEAQPEELPTELPDAQSARDRLEVVMRQKPRRQIVVEAQQVDPELQGHADELIAEAPEATAAVLKQWLRGGA